MGCAPGAAEEVTLRPFSGPGGLLLRTVLSGSGVGEKLYYTNVVKRRPLGTNGTNRKPTKGECWKCGSHLMTEVARHRPQVVLTLGQTPLEFFMGAMKVSQVHGLPLRLTKWQMEMVVIPAYDPAHILRRGGLNSAAGDEFLSDIEDAVQTIVRKGL